jgi:23S rRNA (guanosine2251-2'-O)-methyltransferase
VSDPPGDDRPIVLEGHLSVEAALAAQVRPIDRILAVRPGDRRLGRLRALARERGVLIERVDEGEAAALASGRSHGGVVALVGPRRYLTVDELVTGAGPTPFIVMLDGIEDPFNFGAAARALYAAGTDGLVVRERSWDLAERVITRSSAGASELLPTASTASAEAAAEAVRRHGLQVICAAADPAAIPMHEVDLRGAFVLIGGERRGITRSFLAGADGILAIPYGRTDAPPLGAAAAATLVAFEALRQRSASGSTPRAAATCAANRRGSDGRRGGGAAQARPR